MAARFPRDTQSSCDGGIIHNWFSMAQPLFSTFHTMYSLRLVSPGEVHCVIPRVP